MLFVITGNGKGKTTSGLGMVVRASGQGLKCAVIQFIKTNFKAFGEYRTISSLGIEWEAWGQGFLWNDQDKEKTAKLCKQGWESFKTKAQNGDYGMILLDEFTYVLSFGLLDKDEVLGYLAELKGKEEAPHVVITGRNALPELIDLADTVSEVNEIKHHFRSNGGKTIRGVEF